MSRKWKTGTRNKNEVYEETKEADSRDNVKHNGKSMCTYEYMVRPI